MSKIPNINQLMGMAQTMAKQMEEQMDRLEVEGNAGGGMVTIRMNGHRRILSLILSPQVVDPSDIDMLQDLVVAAFNDANSKVEEQLKGSMGPMSGGMPGGFPFGAM
jgi:nucleoid-associated protein EbfC